MTAQQQVNFTKLINEALNLQGSIGNTYNRFYNYSYMNQILLMYQGTFEPVATYKNWQKLNRNVKKGSKAKFILMPVFYKNDEDEEELAGFKYRNCLFSYSDTEGEELPPVELPEWKLELALEKLKIEREEYRSLNGNTQGYSHDRVYAINPVAKYPVKTTFHELAHIVLGHTNKEQIHEYKEHRGLKEFQAEATAYLIMKELECKEWNEAESRSYIQNWLDNEKPEDKAIKQVFKAVNDILTAGKEANEKK